MTVSITSSAASVTFGAGGFVLHSLDPGAPALRAGSAGERAVSLSAYILAEGGTEAERAAFLDRARRRVCRIAASPDGFTLAVDGRTIRLAADAAPEFDAKPPFNGTDAAFFTLRAHSASGGAYFAGAESAVSARGRDGKLVFPLAVTEATVFATLAAAGEMRVRNPGDAPVGFVAAITAEGGSLSSCTLAAGEHSLRCTHVLADGETLTIDTRSGSKDVRAGGGSVLADVDWTSDFFTLAPGENTLRWESEGGGRAAVRLTLTPVYL